MKHNIYNHIKENTLDLDFDREGFHNLAKDTYNSIKNNNYIPQEIREAWLEACVTFADVNDLTN